MKTLLCGLVLIVGVGCGGLKVDCNDPASVNAAKNNVGDLCTLAALGAKAGGADPKMLKAVGDVCVFASAALRKDPAVGDKLQALLEEQLQKSIPDAGQHQAAVILMELFLRRIESALSEMQNPTQACWAGIAAEGLDRGGKVLSATVTRDVRRPELAIKNWPKS
jgi:hypothetical protein